MQEYQRLKELQAMLDAALLKPKITTGIELHK